MSTKIEVGRRRAYENIRYGAVSNVPYTDGSNLIGNSTYPTAGSIYTVNYKFETPETLLDQETQQDQAITNIQLTKLVFETKDSKQYNHYGGMNLINPSQGNIYGIILKTGTPNKEELYESKESFVVHKYIDNFNSKLVEVELDSSLTLERGTTYYLHLFTKDLSAGSFCYRWPHNASTTQDEVKVYLDCTTYTKLLSPVAVDPIWENQVVKPTNEKISLQWKYDITNVEFLKGFSITWDGAQRGSVNIESGTSEFNECKYEFTTNNAIRGGNITFKIQAIHSKDLNYSSDLGSLGSVIVNSLPTITRVVAPEETKIPFGKESSDKIIFTIVGDDKDEQRLEYKWRSGSEGSFDWYDEGIGLKVQNGKTLEFRAYDGLEDGPIWSCTVGVDGIEGLLVNSPPTLSDFTVGYTFSTDILSPSYTTSETTPIKARQIRPVYQGQFGTWREIESNMKLTDILNGFTGPFSQLQLDGRVIDEYDDESQILSAIIKPDSSQPKPPDTFLSKLTFSDLGDWSLAKQDDNEIDFDIKENVIIIKHPGELTSNKNYTFNLIAKAPTTEGQGSEKPVWKLSVISTTKQFTKINSTPSNTSEGTISIYNPFKAWLEETNETYTWTFRVTSGLEGLEYKLRLTDSSDNFLEVPLAEIKSTNGDTWMGTSTRTGLYNWPSEKNSKVFLSEGYKGGIHKVKASIGYYFMEDANTEVWIGSPAADMTYDFDYIKESPTPSFNEPIQEKQPLFQNLNSFPIATQTPLDFVLQVNRNDDKGYVDYKVTSLTKEVLEGQIKTRPFINEDGALKLPTLTYPLIFGEVGEIITPQDRKWRIITRLNNNQSCKSTSDELTTQVIQHTAPTNFIITNSVWHSGTTEQDPGYALLNFSMNLNTNANASVCDVSYTLEEAEDLSSGQLIPEEAQLKFIPKEKGGPYAIQVKVTTTIGSNIKESSSNKFIIYVDGPTVAYRAHHLGINTTNLNNDSVLTVIPGSDARKFIYLKSSYNEIKINLLDGSIMGAILDCGSWDGTSGGIVPGGNGSSIKVDIADLVQETDTEIIIGDIDEI